MLPVGDLVTEERRSMKFWHGNLFGKKIVWKWTGQSCLRVLTNGWRLKLTVLPARRIIRPLLALPKSFNSGSRSRVTRIWYEFTYSMKKLTRSWKHAAIKFISTQNKKRNGNNIFKEINGQTYYGFVRKITVMLRKCIKKYAFRHLFNIQNSSPTAKSKMRPFYSCSVAVIVVRGGDRRIIIFSKYIQKYYSEIQCTVYNVARKLLFLITELHKHSSFCYTDKIVRTEYGNHGCAG